MAIDPSFITLHGLRLPRAYECAHQNYKSGAIGTVARNQKSKATLCKSACCCQVACNCDCAAEERQDRQRQGTSLDRYLEHIGILDFFSDSKGPIRTRSCRCRRPLNCDKQRPSKEERQAKVEFFRAVVIGA